MKNQYKIKVLLLSCMMAVATATVMAVISPENAGYLSLVPILIGSTVSLVLVFFLVTPVEPPLSVPYRQYLPYHTSARIFAEASKLDFGSCIQSLRQMWMLKRLCGVALLIFGIVVWKDVHSFTPLFATLVAMGYALGFTNTPLPRYGTTPVHSQQTT